MSHDPKAKFVVRELTRAEIAEELNDYIECDEMEIEKFAEDDARLTDEFCQDFAEAMFNAYCDIDETQEREAEYIRGILENL